MTIYILASIKNCKSTDLLKYVNFRSTEVDFRRTGNTKKFLTKIVTLVCHDQ